MSTPPDIIIIGSGPAGVSAAFPLVEAGHHVLMLEADTNVRSNQLCTEELPDAYQQVSPKLKSPLFQEKLINFLKDNNFLQENFLAIGAHISGGLSNFWGAGISCYDDQDLTEWPISFHDLESSYESIINRIGASGTASHFPATLRLQSDMPLDKKHTYLLNQYRSAKHSALSLWPAHNAVLTQSRGNRFACDMSGSCLTGCAQKSIWNANFDIERLLEFPNFKLVRNAFVRHLENTPQGWLCHASDEANNNTSFKARRVVLAAGTLGTTRLILSSFKIPEPVKFHSNPCAAFILLLPSHLLKRADRQFYGMAQLNYSQKLSSESYVFGNLFNTRALPASTYLNHTSLPEPLARALLLPVFSAGIVANCFFDGNLSHHHMQRKTDGHILIQGRYVDHFALHTHEARESLAATFAKLGAWMLPMSFRQGAIGSDVHYAGSFPMRKNPKLLETDSCGQLSGHDALYIADGASFTNLPAKPLTLTLMANADRIGRHLTQRISA